MVRARVFANRIIGSVDQSACRTLYSAPTDRMTASVTASSPTTALSDRIRRSNYRDACIVNGVVRRAIDRSQTVYARAPANPIARSAFTVQSNRGVRRRRPIELRRERTRTNHAAASITIHQWDNSDRERRPISCADRSAPDA